MSRLEQVYDRRVETTDLPLVEDRYYHMPSGTTLIDADSSAVLDYRERIRKENCRSLSAWPYGFLVGLLCPHMSRGSVRPEC